MNELLNRVLGLEGVAFGGEDVVLELARPLAPWMWALGVLVAATFSWWCYRRLIGPRSARATLGVVRTLLLLLVLLLVAGPRLVRERTRVEPDWVVVLADRSGSMGVPDAPGGLTRDEQLARALGATGETWSDIGESKRLLWLGFDAGAFELGGTLVAPQLGDADGRRTALGVSIEQALRRVAARPTSGLVVLSDGRSSDTLPRATLRRLQSEQIPVFSVPLGSPDPAPDLGVTAVEAPELAFVRDSTPVSVELERLGEGTVNPESLLQLVDEATGEILAERPVGDALRDANSARLTLTPRAETPGPRRWVARVVPRGDDMIRDNNEMSVAIELVDRPLRVLYIDGYPRWENRYVKNLLLREQSIRSTGLLLAANRRYTQDGDVSVTRLPQSPGEWEEYDVIVLGDLRSDLLGRTQLEALREHIAVRGAGLLWIAGEGATPETWFETPLGDLLPVRAASEGSSLDAWDQDVTLVRTPEGARLGVLELGDTPGVWPERLSDPRTGWSRLRWMQRIEGERVKPAATVLASGVPVSAFTPELLEDQGREAMQAGSPAVLTMRYGAGRIVYVATDEIWRWRYGRGEDLHERFWLPLIRMLGREGLARSGRPALLRATPERGQVGRALRLSLELLDQSLVDAAPTSVRVEITRDDADAGSRAVELRLSPEGVSEVDESARSFGSSWATNEPGTYTVRVTEPLLAPLGLTESFEIWPSDDERRRPETDHASLAELAEQTGGRVVPVSQLSTLGDLLPNRELVITGPREEQTLWDRPIVLALLIVLLGAEWIGRRLIRLA
ncbi:MAG: hypothetical protein ACIARR_13065 [Phycisphaerales bacterium JB059]